MKRLQMYQFLDEKIIGMQGDLLSEWPTIYFKTKKSQTCTATNDEHSTKFHVSSRSKHFPVSSNGGLT